MHTTKLCNKPEKHTVKIDCHLKSLPHGSLIKSKTKKIGTDQYCIQFTPTPRGQNELTVSVDGRQVAGIPFPVFASVPPTQLSQSLKVWDGIEMPIGITVNTAGEIIVTEYEGDIVVLDKGGQRLRNINHTEHKFIYLHGVAVDGEDNIYFTDAGTNQIFKSNCSKVQEYKAQQVEGPGHDGAAVVGDEVMVTECGNGGRIMVYDRELKYVRQIDGSANKTLCGLSSDSHQNVYVRVCGMSSIQVFSNDGEFLRSFRCDENGVKRLEDPWGVVCG